MENISKKCYEILIEFLVIKLHIQFEVVFKKVLFLDTNKENFKILFFLLGILKSYLFEAAERLN